MICLLSRGLLIMGLKLLFCGIFSDATKELQKANAEKAIFCIYVTKTENRRNNFNNLLELWSFLAV